MTITIPSHHWHHLGSLLHGNQQQDLARVCALMQKVSPPHKTGEECCPIATIHGVSGTRYDSEALSIDVASELVITGTQKAPRHLAEAGWGSTNCEKSMFEPPDHWIG